MILHPTPVRLDGPLRSERQLLRHRRLACPSYARCLDESVRRKWESFSCSQCPMAAQELGPRPEVARYAFARKGDPFVG